MNVKEFIEKLQTMDPEATVITTSSNFELNFAMIDVNSIRQYDTAEKKSQTFRDAFDGDTYNKQIWNIFGGDKKVVLIG